MKKYLSLVWIIMSAMVIGCRKDTVKPYPLLLTLPVSNIDTDGATFSGEAKALGEEAILEHGFFFYLRPPSSLLLIPDEGARISLGTLDRTGVFSTRVEAGLPSGARFYIRAYMKTATSYIYGEERVFVSKGSKSIENLTIYPKAVVPGDTIWVTGQNLTNFGNENYELTWGIFDLEILSVRKDSISAIVPGLVSENDPIVLKSAVTATITLKSPKILTPVLLSVDPDQIGDGDTITIKGKNFSPAKKWNDIRLLGSQKQPNILSNTKDQLVIVIDNWAEWNRSESGILITNSVNFSNFLPITVKAPEIFDFSPKEGIYGDTITLTGRNLPVSTNPFQPVDVRWGSFEPFPIVSNTSKIMKFLVSDFLIGDKLRDSKPVRILDPWGNVSSNESFTYVQRDWNIFSSLPRVSSASSTAFAIDGHLYYAPEKDFYPLYEFDFLNKSWKEKPFSLPSDFTSTSVIRGCLPVGNELFVIFQHQRYQSNITLDCKMYNVSSNTWKNAGTVVLNQDAGEHLEDHELVFFHVQHKIYWCLPGTANTNLVLNLENGEVSSIKDHTLSFPAMDHDIYPIAAVSGNSFGYILFDTQTGRQLLQYSPQTDTWNRVGKPNSNLNLVHQSRSSFELNGKIYFISTSGYEVIEYNPNSNSIHVTALPNPPSIAVLSYTAPVLPFEGKVFMLKGESLFQWFPRQ